MATAEGEILASERVSANALCTASLERWWTDAPQDVHAMSDGIEVVYADASVVAADVVQFDTLGHIPAKQYPDPDVRRSPLTVQHRVGVAMVAACEPACGDVARSPEVDLVEQALRQVLVSGWDHQPKGTN